MKAKVEHKNIIDFEIKKQRYYLGKSDKYIEFDDGDSNLPVRAKKANDRIKAFFDATREKYGLEAGNIEDVAKKMPNEKQLELIAELDSFVREQINYIFNEDNICDIVFGNASTLTPTPDGKEYYFEHFLNKLAPVLEQQFTLRVDMLSKNAQKYLKGKK